MGLSRYFDYRRGQRKEKAMRPVCCRQRTAARFSIELGWIRNMPYRREPRHSVAKLPPTHRRQRRLPQHEEASGIFMIFCYLDYRIAVEIWER